MSEPITTKQISEGKSFETTVHADGRRDVSVTVRALDVDLSDPSNVKAKEVIENEVIPRLAGQEVTVTVIHKPTNEYTTFRTARANVRRYAAQIVAGKGTNPVDEFILVENDGERVVVTTL